MYQTMYKLTLAACVFLVGCGGAPFVEADPASLSTDDAPSAQQHLPEDAGAAADSAPDVVGDRGDGGSVGEDAGVASAREAASDAAPKSDTGADGGSAPVCLPTLSGVGTGDFRIAFTLTTTYVPATGSYMALLNQRSRCDDTQPGWDVWMTAQGNLGVEVFDGSGSAYDYVTDSRAVNDGAPHRVAVVRSGTSLVVEVDGVAETYPSEPAMSLATLSPLDTGVDPECSGVRDLSGQLTEICVSKQ